MNICQNCILYSENPAVTAYMSTVMDLERDGRIPAGTGLDVITITCQQSGCSYTVE